MSLSKQLTLCLKFLQIYSNRICIVNYAPAMGGMALLRIINADSRFVWSKELSNMPSDEVNAENSILYPDTVEGFNIPLNGASYHYDNFKKIHLGTAHVLTPHLFLSWKLKKEEEYMIPLFSHLHSILSTNKGILLIPSHADTAWLENFLPETIKVVNVVGNNLNRAVLESTGPTQCKTELSYKDNFINIDTNKLFNKNYNIFEKEYIELCNKLDLTYKGNSVRAFILLWIEKQERLLSE
jgi:hypothetical protein